MKICLLLGGLLIICGSVYSQTDELNNYGSKILFSPSDTITEIRALAHQISNDSGRIAFQFVFQGQVNPHLKEVRIKSLSKEELILDRPIHDSIFYDIISTRLTGIYSFSLTGQELGFLKGKEIKAIILYFPRNELILEVRNRSRNALKPF